MSHSASTVSLHDVPAIVTAAPPTLPRVGKLLLAVMVGFGLCAFVVALQANPERAWAVFHVNFTYFFVMAAASSCFAAVFTICNAQWARPIRRIFEAASPYFLWSMIPFVLIYLFGYEHIFHHHHSVTGGKAVWLSRNFMYLRDGVAMLLVIYLGRKVIFYGLRQDIGAIRGGLTGLKKEDLFRWHSTDYDKYVVGWGSDAKRELAEIQYKKGMLSPVVVIVYAVALSLFAFDQIMSIDPHWISTLFGAFIFMSGVYMAMAWNSMGVGFLREMSPLIRAKIYRSTLHDLGKLLFGFGIFWTYLFWSHYLTIWYGNIPEETGWLITRARLEPWHTVSWSVLCMLFFFPFFFGLNKDGKQIPRLLFSTSCVVAVGGWVLFFVLVVPTLFPTSVPFGIVELLISLGFVGAFLLSAIHYLERVPLIPFGDLYLENPEH